jgi:hypothetical protein
MGTLARVETVNFTVYEIRIEDRRHLTDTQWLNLRRVIRNLRNRSGHP